MVDRQRLERLEKVLYSIGNDLSQINRSTTRWDSQDFIRASYLVKYGFDPYSVPKYLKEEILPNKEVWNVIGYFNTESRFTACEAIARYRKKHYPTTFNHGSDSSAGSSRWRTKTKLPIS